MSIEESTIYNALDKHSLQEVTFEEAAKLVRPSSPPLPASVSSDSR